MVAEPSVQTTASERCLVDDQWPGIGYMLKELQKMDAEDVKKMLIEKMQQGHFINMVTGEDSDNSKGAQPATQMGHRGHVEAAQGPAKEGGAFLKAMREGRQPAEAGQEKETAEEEHDGDEQEEAKEEAPNPAAEKIPSQEEAVKDETPKKTHAHARDEFMKVEMPMPETTYIPRSFAPEPPAAPYIPQSLASGSRDIPTTLTHPQFFDLSPDTVNRELIPTLLMHRHQRSKMIAPTMTMTAPTSTNIVLHRQKI